MTQESYFLFILVCIAATVSPGPAILLIVSNSLKYGFYKSAMTALGNIFGLLLFCVISFLGLSTVLSETPMFFQGVKIAGALYLFYLGLKSWFTAPQAKAMRLNENSVQLPGFHKFGLFVEAFGVAVSNPKAILFVFALFPQFLNMDSKLAPQFIVMTLTLMFFSFCFLMLYSYFASRFAAQIEAGIGYKRLYQVTGILFVGVGILFLV